LAKIGEPNQKSCSQCAKCCITHPCALAPSDLGEIADHFDLPEEEIFKRYLVLDYLETDDERLYYVCPARKDDKPGTIVEPGWTFSDSSCIFLNGRTCSIQEVKPKGGKSLFCSLMLNSSRNLVGYGKTNSARDWNRTDILKVLLNVANEHKEERKIYPRPSQYLVIEHG
jgi:Fe-S-cluster containining protein